MLYVLLIVLALVEMVEEEDSIEEGPVTDADLCNPSMLDEDLGPDGKNLLAFRLERASCHWKHRKAGKQEGDRIWSARTEAMRRKARKEDVDVEPDDEKLEGKTPVNVELDDSQEGEEVEEVTEEGEDATESQEDSEAEAEAEERAKDEEEERLFAEKERDIERQVAEAKSAMRKQQKRIEFEKRREERKMVWEEKLKQRQKELMAIQQAMDAAKSASPKDDGAGKDDCAGKEEVQRDETNEGKNAKKAKGGRKTNEKPAAMGKDRNESGETKSSNVDGPNDSAVGKDGGSEEPSVVKVVPRARPRKAEPKSIIKRPVPRSPPRSVTASDVIDLAESPADDQPRGKKSRLDLQKPSAQAAIKEKAGRSGPPASSDSPQPSTSGVKTTQGTKGLKKDGKRVPESRIKIGNKKG